MKGSKKDLDIVEIMKKLRDILSINSDTEIVKSCIRKAYDLHFSKLEKPHQS